MGTSIGRREFLCRAAGALAFLGLGGGFLADVTLAGNLPRELVSAARPAIEQLQKAYSHASITGTRRIDLPGTNKFSEQKFVMRVSGDSRRLDLTTVAQKGMNLTVGANVLQMATPQGSLSTQTKPGSKVFDDAQQTSYDKTVDQIAQGSLINYVYGLDVSGNVLDLLLRPDVKITDMKHMTTNGLPLVRIDFTQQATYGGRNGKWTSWVLFSPSESWAIREFSRSVGQGADRLTQQARLTYSGLEKGIPLVQSIESETLTGNDQKRVRRESIVVSTIKLSEPDGVYFTGFAF
jgi:hypothetical protein